MRRSKKDYIKVRLGGKTLLAITLYTAIMMVIGAAMKSCHDDAQRARVKIESTKTK